MVLATVYYGYLCTKGMLRYHSLHARGCSGHPTRLKSYYIGFYSLNERDYMKMTKKAEEALKASIKHWKDDILTYKMTANSRNCPLCTIYNKNDTDCKGCPIRDKTGLATCNGTPYDDYIDADTPHEITKAALDMIKFMEDLL